MQKGPKNTWQLTSAEAEELGTRPRLTRVESALFLTGMGFPISPGQLQKLASVGGGPEYEVWGKHALSTPPNLLSWARSRLSAPRNNTSGLSRSGTSGKGS